MSILELIKTRTESHNATLVAVSKTKPNVDILELYNQNQRHFGENRVQELVDKYESLPKDIYWHQIGHLQKNKVKYIAPFVHLIHAVDSWELITTIQKEAAKNNRIISILLQVKIAEEESKFGLSLSELEVIIHKLTNDPLANILVCGLMGMASFTDNHDQVKEEFTLLKTTFDRIKTIYFPENESFKEISMGMSGDYLLALECGSTMVRVGSLLFGSR